MINIFVTKLTEFKETFRKNSIERWKDTCKFAEVLRNSSLWYTWMCALWLVQGILKLNNLHRSVHPNLVFLREDGQVSSAYCKTNLIYIDVIFLFACCDCMQIASNLWSPFPHKSSNLYRNVGFLYVSPTELDLAPPRLPRDGIGWEIDTIMASSFNIPAKKYRVS